MKIKSKSDKRMIAVKKIIPGDVIQYMGNYYIVGDWCSIVSSVRDQITRHEAATQGTVKNEDEYFVPLVNMEGGGIRFIKSSIIVEHKPDATLVI